MAICQTKVVHAQAVADNVTHLKLAVPEGCQWMTGQFARIAMPSTAEPQWRCYSIFRAWALPPSVGSPTRCFAMCSWR